MSYAVREAEKTIKTMRKAVNMKIASCFGEYKALISDDDIYGVGYAEPGFISFPVVLWGCQHH